MSYLIVTLFLLAIFQWVYESILAPSFRLDLRLRLFALRDELSDLKASSGRPPGDEQSFALLDSMNNLIAGLERFDIAMLAAVEREVRRSPELLARAEVR